MLLVAAWSPDDVDTHFFNMPSCPGSRSEDKKLLQECLNFGTFSVLLRVRVPAGAETAPCKLLLDKRIVL